MPINQPADAGQIEALIGARGHSACNSSNRNLFRQWITAKGWGADFAAILSVRELSIAYNAPPKGGVPGQDQWLDKRLKEFKERQGEARGQDAARMPVQQAMDLGADLGDGEARDAQGNPNDMGDAEAEAAEALDDDGAGDLDLDNLLNIPKAPPPDLRAQDEARKEVQDRADQLAQMIRDLVADKPAPKPEIDPAQIEAMVNEKVKEALDKAQYSPKVIEIQKDGELVKRIEGKMPAWFPRVLKLLQRGQNVLLVGPAGCGKTYVAEKLAEALDAEFGAIHGSAGASESQLTGWFLPVGKEGTFEYVPSRFVTLYERGNSLFLFDELDGFDPNMLLVVNGALANGHLHIAHRVNDPCVTRGKDCRIIATANTFGTGANPIYAGRAPLDGSTLDRFITVEVDYDTELERSMAQDLGLEQHEAEALWTLRTKVREQSLRRIISTRAFQKAGAMKACGDTWDTTLNTLCAGWTRDERAKVGM